MNSDVNNYTASGKLIKEPQVRETPSGITVCDLFIIINKPKNKNKNIQGKIAPTILPITLWEHSAEYWGDRLRKNDHIFVSGEMVDNNFEKPNNKDCSQIHPGHDLIMLAVIP